MQQAKTTVTDRDDNTAKIQQGLDPKTVTEEQVNKALKKIHHFSEMELVPTLKMTETNGALHVQMALPNVSIKMQERLKPVLQQFAEEINVGSIQGTWNDPNPIGRYPIIRDTFEFDIHPAQQPELVKALAQFVNDEVELQHHRYRDMGGNRPIEWKEITEIQFGTGAAKS